MECGIGINDYDGRVGVNGKHIKPYETWRGLLRRCYSEKFHEKQPTYKNCTVSEEWLYFSHFKNWFDENYKFDLEILDITLELDKDLLIEGNKVYSAENCIFLPKKVNKFLANKQNNNTSGYTGVCFDKGIGKWRARISDFDTGKLKHLGLFSDIELASEAYIRARQLEVIKVKQWVLDLGYEKYIVDRIK